MKSGIRYTGGAGGTMYPFTKHSPTFVHTKSISDIDKGPQPIFLKYCIIGTAYGFKSTTLQNP